ncbi:MAG: transposase [Methanothrix sp.]
MTFQNAKDRIPAVPCRFHSNSLTSMIQDPGSEGQKAVLVHSRLDPVIDCAKMIKHHWNGATNYIKTKIDNGILEGTNSLIQAAKDSARGFRSTNNFIITIYLMMGKLEFNLPM